jgi:hypothetical protein
LVVNPSRRRFELALDFETPLVHCKPRKSWVSEQRRALPVVLLFNGAMDHESNFGSDCPVVKYQPALILHHSPKTN